MRRRATARLGWMLGTIALATAQWACSDGNADDFVWGRTPVFTPDGASIVYAQNLSTPSDQVTNSVTSLDAGAIFSIPVGGGQPTQLTPEGRGPDFFPAVSPDGTKIAYVSGEDGQFDVWVMNLNGSGRRALTFDQATDTTPAWSPDGTRIVFVSERAGNNDLWSVRLDGSGLEQLTTFPSDEATPQYSPDGTRIAFASNRDRSNFDIWIMNADGSGLTQVTRKDEPASDISDGSPAWSPAGTSLVFERWDSNWDVYGVATDGTGLLNLTLDEDHDGDPKFSPDGATVAFTSSRSGWWQVWLMAPDGSNPRQLTGR